jgi:hypothetical protein
MEELIERLSRYSPQCIAERLDPDFAEANVDAIEMLKAIDAIKKLSGSEEIAPVQYAEWQLFRTNQEPLDAFFICSNCGQAVGSMDSVIYAYCPRCGARMRGV